MAQHALRLIALFLFLISSQAHAIPTMADHWRFNCAPTGASAGKVKKARNKSGRSGIAMLNYACVMSAYEISQYLLKINKFEEGGSKRKSAISKSKKIYANPKSCLKKAFKKYKRSKNNLKIAYWDGYALGLLKDEWAVNRFDDIMRRGSKSKEP